MFSEQGMKEASEAIGRALSEHLPVEYDAPDRLRALLHQLKLRDEGNASRDDRQR